MKAVILERKGSEAAVLTENGTFMKVRHTGSVGEEIEIRSETAHINILRSAVVRSLAAAALVLVVLGGSYHYMAVSVSAYVSIDAGGSSLELTVNRLGRVTSVISVSDDDSELAETISSNTNGMRVEDAVSTALNTLIENGKISSQDDLMIVGITSDSDGQAESLESAIIDNVGLPVYMVRVSGDAREEAHKQELGGGRYVYEYEDAVILSSGNETDTPEAVGDIIPVTTTAENVDIPAQATITVAEQPVVETQTSAAEAVPPVPGISESGQYSEAEPPPLQSGRGEQNDDAHSFDESTIPPQQSEQIPGQDHRSEPEEYHDETRASDGGNPPQQSGQPADGDPRYQHGEQEAPNEATRITGEGVAPQLSGQLPESEPYDQQDWQNGGSSFTGEGRGSPQEQTVDPLSSDAPDRITPPVMSVSASEFRTIAAFN